MNESNSSMIVDVKAQLLNKFRDTVKQVEMDFQSRASDTEELLRKAQADQDKILEMLNNQMRSIEGENVKLSEQIEGLKKAAEAAREEKEEAERAAEAVRAEKEEAETKAETIRAEKEEAERVAEAAQVEKEEAEKKADNALGEKAEMEKKIEEATRNVETLNEQIATLKDDLNESVTISEAAVREKAQLQEKLNQFQEHWEKHVAGR